jgi:hypothetical protein
LPTGKPIVAAVVALLPVVPCNNVLRTAITTPTIAPLIVLEQHRSAAMGKDKTFLLFTTVISKGFGEKQQS